MYKSPIEIFQTGIEYQLENDIMNMIQKYGITVDKDELLKALRYDRDQYDKGYADGKRAANDELVRCKDCDYCHEYIKWNGREYLGCYRLAKLCDGHIVEVGVNDCCSWGERREDNEG